jgi:hypothetical protein
VHSVFTCRIPSEVEEPCAHLEAGCPTLFSRTLRKRVGGDTAVKPDSWKGHDFSRAIKTRKRFRHRKPARPDKKQIACSPLFQSLRRPVNHLPSDGIILNLDVAVGKAAPRVPRVSRLSRHGIPCSGVIRIVLAISINSSNSSARLLLRGEPTVKQPRDFLRDVQSGSEETRTKETDE